MPIGRDPQRFSRAPFIEQPIDGVLGDFNFRNLVDLAPHGIRAVHDQHRLGPNRYADQQHAHNGGEALQTLGSHSAGDRHVV